MNSTPLGSATRPSTALAWRWPTAPSSLSSLPGCASSARTKALTNLSVNMAIGERPPLSAAVEANPDLANDLSAAAHLIHGSSEGRFRITWCPGHLSKQEVESVGFELGNLRSMLKLYDPAKLAHGYNTGERRRDLLHLQPGPRPLGAQQQTLDLESLCQNQV